MNDWLTWITGLYYYRESGRDTGITEALPAFTPPGVPLTYNSYGPNLTVNKSFAAYTQETYSITSQLRLTAGVRWTQDERDPTFHDDHILASNGAYESCALANAANATTYDECVYSNSVKYHYFPWTVGLDYTADPAVLLYAKVSAGYRSGAWADSRPQATGNPTQDAAVVATYAPVAPEKLLSPEIGMKSEFFDHTLRVNAALYYSNYSNIQVNVNLPQPCPTCSPLDVLRNSGEAHIYGGEVQAN